MDLRGKTLLASGFHAPVAGRVELLEQALIAVDDAGVIVSVTAGDDPGYAETVARCGNAGHLVRLPAGHYLLPGFVDCHVHAPQYPQTGKALDVKLETWLQAYTFPLEARYADLAFARLAYQALVADLLAAGTTTALYFATLHQDATRLLVDICLEQGQRALVGKVVMDHAQTCPADYRDTGVDEALNGTRALIDYVRGHPDNRSGLVQPVITPRFIPACTDGVLAGLGAMAASTGCHVQTHASESDWEHDHVLARHGMTDTESLDRFGLLGPRTMLAHGNFLTPADMTRIAARRAAVAHCPLSNGYFAGAVFPLRAALAKGLKIGLGTDISGGPSASMLESARAAILVSRLLESGVDPALPPAQRASGAAARIDVRDAFHLATAGGGRALGLPVGQFASGYEFDALVIDTTARHGTIRLFEGVDDGEAILQKIIYGASRANIAEVFVAGRHVV
jgi:guanine deaminase